MQLVGVGEGQIREALAALKADGCVTCTAMTQEGWSAQFWLLAEGGR
jgi:DNA-binding GntR family transcriptional regulator